MFTLRNLLLVVQVISVVFLFIESVYVFSKLKTDIHKYLFLNCIATLINNTGYFLMMISVNEEQCFAGLLMSYFGRVWIPFSLFIFALKICKIEIKKYLIILLAFLHTFIYCLVFTSRWHGLYYAKSEYIYKDGWSFFENENGIIHNIYSVVLILYIVVGMFLLIRNTIKEKMPIAKIRMTFVTVAILIQCMGFIVNLTGVTHGYDCTVMGYAVGTLFMIIAIFRFKLLDTLEIARDYVIDELSEAIMVINNDGKLEYYNKPATEILFRNDSENEYEDWIARMEDAIESDKPIELAGRLYSPNIKTLFHNDESCGKIYVLVDDTDHYNYMQKIKEQRDIAEEANASKSAFLSIVSHEIRTPMNAVIGMTDLLLRDSESLSDKQEKYLKNISTSGQSLVMIVNDILDQSKIEAGKMEIIEQPYEIRPMADDVKLIIENRIGSKPIHLIYEIEDDVPQYLIGDSLRIRQILINLMNNAVKFTETGYIRLKVEVTDEKSGSRLLRFSVKDSGQGIRPEDLSKLGQAFTQVDTKKNHSKEGTGLGLSISRDFISMMGGLLEVTSEYGKGSEFYFEIWQGIANGLNSNDSVVMKQPWQTDTEFRAPEARVLIVDDAELNLMITEELLKPVGMTVDVAQSGETALEMIEKNHYHAIFMDYMMPYLDGVETTKLIRKLALEKKDDYYKYVPIIALSGDTSDSTRESFMCAGIDDFTEKPVEVKKLKKLLLKWLPKELIKSVANK